MSAPNPDKLKIWQHCSEKQQTKQKRKLAKIGRDETQIDVEKDRKGEDLGEDTAKLTESDKKVASENLDKQITAELGWYLVLF